MESCKVIVDLSDLVTCMETGFQGAQNEHSEVPELVAIILPTTGRIMLIRIAAINTIIMDLTSTGLPAFFEPGGSPEV
jgi:hypothetical protein